MRARAELRVEGAGRLSRVVSAPPVTFRRAADAVYLVGTAAGPLGDDHVEVRLDVCDGGALRIRSAAATMIYAGAGSRQRFDVTVGRGGTLDWHPEPVIATAGCHHLQDVRIDLAGDARLDWTEELVLGRHGEEPGQIELRMRVELGGRPLLRHDLAVGRAGWDGPAVLGNQRAAGLRLVVGPLPPPPVPQPPATSGPGWAWLPLDAAPLNPPPLDTPALAPHGPPLPAGAPPPDTRAHLLVAHGADLPELRRRMAEAAAPLP